MPPIRTANGVQELPQLWVDLLALLNEHGPMSVREVADLTGEPFLPARAVAAFRGMAARGLVQREMRPVEAGRIASSVVRAQVEASGRTMEPTGRWMAVRRIG